MRRRTILVLATALLALTAVTPTAAAPPSDDPDTAAAYGARWLAAQVSPEGFLTGPDDQPSPGQTAAAALSLAAAGVEGPTFERMVDWLEANIEDYVSGSGTDSPGAIGTAMLVAVAAGRDEDDFGGVDLSARLAATLGDFEPGLYGAADPTFDGVYRQGLAILGLLADGEPVPGAALDWLEDQQCDSGPAGAIGGWTAYRSPTTDPCPAPDPATFAGPDTNSTALAVQALEAAGRDASSAVPFLRSAAGDDGGYPYIPGGDVDPNSTGLVIQALVALDQDPAAALTSLLAWQLGCDASPADVGAFASPFSDGDPDQFATIQAVWGAAGAPFPLGEVDFQPAPTPCVDPEPTPTAGGDGDAAGVPGGGTSGPATALPVTPTFAG